MTIENRNTMASFRSSLSMPLNDSCSVCSSPDCDLKLIGCGCKVHVTCLPLSLILDATVKGGANNLLFGPRLDENVFCPACLSGSVQGIHVLPLSFERLKKSVQLRVAEAKASGEKSQDGNISGNKRDRSESEDYWVEVEATKAVFSQGKTAPSSNDSDSNRTGRWTDAEMKYADHLLMAFDKGHLPLPHGTKLANFLSGALMCKATRLTKKMKYAQLSTRSYAIQPCALQTNANIDDASILKVLQDRFVLSLSSEYSQLELAYNLSMFWRSCFSDFCLQVGYEGFDGSSFIASLEEYECLVASAEDSFRSVRRRRFAGGIGLADMTLVDDQTTKGDLLAPALSVESFLPAKTATASSDADCMEFLSLSTEFDHVDHGGNADFVANLDAEVNDSFVMGIFDAEETRENALPVTRLERAPSKGGTPRSPFLEVIADYLEQLDLPFQHADVWVPSYVCDDCVDGVRLMQAGAVTRRDQDGERWSAFESFGRYSETFTFSPGKGLVGRVYSSGKPLWEFGINKLDPDIFLRAGGAEEYGVRTALAIPFSTPGVGRMVVILYSCNHIPEDDYLADQLARELSSYAPTPQWKMVVEMSDIAVPLSTTEQEVQSFSKRNVSDISSNTGQDTYAAVAETAKDVEDVERTIVSLLGEQLAFQDEASFDDPSLFQEVMRIRLILLRTANLRSLEENDKINVLKESYKNYWMGGQRNGRELATLLAREWQFLSQCSNGGMNGDQSSNFANPMIEQALLRSCSSSTSSEYKSHEFAPSLQPLKSVDDSLVSMLGRGISAPLLQHHHPHPKNASPRLYNTQNNGPIVSYDHSIPSSSALTLSQRESLYEFSSPMRRTVSYASILPGSPHVFI